MWQPCVKSCPIKHFSTKNRSESNFFAFWGLEGPYLNDNTEVKQLLLEIVDFFVDHKDKEWAPLREAYSDSMFDRISTTMLCDFE